MTINGIFDDTSVLTELIAVDPVTVDDDGTEVTVVAPNGLLVGFSKSFPAIDILNAGGEVSHKLTVAANQFTLTAERAHPDGDFKNKAKYEYDNVSVKIRAVIKDRAGNTGQQTTNESSAFILDSRPPGVKILYPKPSGTDSTRFSASVEQVDVDFLGESGIQSYLKPFEFRNR